MVSTPCGAPTARGKLRCRDACAFAQRPLSLPLSQLKERVDPAILKKVSAGIWPDLLVKVLEYEDGTSTAGLTTEQVIFWDVFQSETYKDVVVEAKARYTYNRGSALAKREATAALMYQARGVFAAEELACVWQPLAVQCRPHPVLPPLPLPLAHASAEAILEEQRHEDSKRYDFLMPPPKDLLRRAEEAWGYIVATPAHMQVPVPGEPMPRVRLCERIVFATALSVSGFQ